MSPAEPCPPISPRWARFRRAGAAVAGFLVIFTGLTVWRLSDYFPLPDNPLRLHVELDPGERGRPDPLLVTGRVHAGDFLSIRYVDTDTIRFAYDSWGVPAVVSQPVPLPPDRRLELEISLPSLTHVLATLGEPANRVRVQANGAVVLDAAARFHQREPGHLWFGENPLGGSARGERLHGRIHNAAGLLLVGATQERGGRERLVAWLRHQPAQVAWIALCSGALIGAMLRLLRSPRALRTAAAAGWRHRWCIGTIAANAVAFTWMVTYGSFRLQDDEVFGGFYDYQAASLLSGRLDVPEAAIGGEAFEARGKLYGYFGPTPALLRMPFVLAGIGFGELNRLFMLLYFTGTLLVAYRILCDARSAPQTCASALPSGPPHPWATVLLLTSVGLGSTVFFLGNRAIVFHEAILAGIAFALASAWCALRHLARPEGRWWIGALGCGVLSLHCRPPTGLFALTLLGTVAVIACVRSRQGIGRMLGIGTACAVALFSLNALAYAKFRTFDAAPLRLSRPYADPARLAKIEGKSFHLVNLPYNFNAYVLHRNARLEPTFPWIFMESRTPGRPFPQAKLDLPDSTLALPYAMPSLFFLATVGALAAAWLHPALRWPLLALWLAVLPMALALFAAVATAQRYTGDFCPFLIATAALALGAVERLPVLLRRLTWAALGLLTVTAVAVTFALTLRYQREIVWGVPEEVRTRYQQTRQQVDTFFRQRLASSPAPTASAP